MMKEACSVIHNFQQWMLEEGNPVASHLKPGRGVGMRLGALLVRCASTAEIGRIGWTGLLPETGLADRCADTGTIQAETWLDRRGRGPRERWRGVGLSSYLGSCPVRLRAGGIRPGGTARRGRGWRSWRALRSTRVTA